VVAGVKAGHERTPRYLRPRAARFQQEKWRTGATEALPRGEEGGARSWGRGEAGGQRWLGTGPSPGGRAASPSRHSRAMLQAARGPASPAAQAASAARPAACRTGALTKPGRLHLTPVPCLEQQPRLWAEQTEVEPWGGWRAAPALRSVAGFVTQGPKDTCRQGPELEGSSPPQTQSYGSHSFHRVPAAPVVQSSPASPHPRAVGYPRSDGAAQPQDPPRGTGNSPTTHTRVHTDAAIRACTQMPAPACTPRHAPGRTCSHTSACPQVPPRPGPTPRLLPVLRVTATSGLASPPGSALPVAMAMLCLPADEVCSPTPRRGAKSSPGGPGCPCCPRLCLSACTLWCCSSDVSSPATPIQPRCWTLGPGIQLTSPRRAVCETRAHVKECPLVGHPFHHWELPSPSFTTQRQALPGGRQDADSLDLPHSAPHPRTAPGPVCGALQSPASSEPTRAGQCPLPGCTIVGFTILTRAGTYPAGSHVEGTGCCHSMPCCAMPSLPAGQDRGGGGQG